MFYCDNGYPEFYDTAHFLKTVRKMWNTTDVKTRFTGQASRDDSLEPVTDASDDKLSCLLQFASWVKLWQNKTVSFLSKETSTAVHQTSIALVAHYHHLPSTLSPLKITSMYYWVNFNLMR